MRCASPPPGNSQPASQPAIPHKEHPWTKPQTNQTPGMVSTIPTSSVSSTPPPPVPPPLASVVGHAVVLLSDWDSFGLAERVGLHLEWIEARGPVVTVAPTPTVLGGRTVVEREEQDHDDDNNNNNNNNDSVANQPRRRSTGGNTIAAGQRLPPHRRQGGESVRRSLGANDDEDDDDPTAPPLHFLPRCGVSALLECTPKDGRLRGSARRRLRTEIRACNARGMRGKLRGCHQPKSLPLRIAPSSHVVYVYETTRIAFCLDASPTLTGTYGFGSSSGRDRRYGGAYAKACCPLDRLIPMARTFFASLVKPVPAQQSLHPGPATVSSSDNENNDKAASTTLWQPELAVTVLAVFPRGTNAEASTRLLVRDFRLRDAAGAELLAKNLEEWALGPVESDIASRLAHPPTTGSGITSTLLSTYAAGTMPRYATRLRDLLAAGDAVLSTLASAARPIVVVATDARAIACDAVIDVVSDPNRVDVPLVVLDLSSPESHRGSNATATAAAPSFREAMNEHHSFHLLSHDPAGPPFPLHLSDDSEALHAVCRATGGCYFDAALLEEAAVTIAGSVPAESVLHVDHCFSNKRRTVKPNAVRFVFGSGWSTNRILLPSPSHRRFRPPTQVQWYTLFALSPLTPVAHSHLGCLPPPEYLRSKPSLPQQQPAPPPPLPQPHPPSTSREKSATSTSSGSGLEGPADASSSYNFSKKSQTRFAMYVINPVRVKSLVLMRIKEGCRARLYGTSTNDPDKVSIQFVLPLDLGNALHYELSYKALPGYNHMIGFANVKIDLAGESSFIQAVKRDFLRPDAPGAARPRPWTLAQRVSLRLCELLRWIRTEDMLQSYLSPLKWSDQLSQPDTPLVKRLASLTALQRRRHFRRDEFDCVWQGRTPYDVDDSILAEFRYAKGGDQQLVEAVGSWATQTMDPGQRYIKQMSGDLPNYAVVELHWCRYAPRAITVSVESFGDIEPNERLQFLAALQEALDALKDVGVLSKQMAPFLVPLNRNFSAPHASEKDMFLKCQHRHASWDLVRDPELFPLLVRRRIEIGGFFLLDSGNDHALLAKLRSKTKNERNPRRDEEDPGVLVQYHLSVMDDKIVVDLLMEAEGGEFAHSMTRRVGSRESLFDEMTRALQSNDQECGKALSCRTMLRNALHTPATVTESLHRCVKRLLAYASHSVLKLRSFGPDCGNANDELRFLICQGLLGNCFGAKVAMLPEMSGEQLGLPEAHGSDWFVIEFDRQTMSLASLSPIDLIDPNSLNTRTYRELSLYTFSTGDVSGRNT